MLGEAMIRNIGVVITPNQKECARCEGWGTLASKLACHECGGVRLTCPTCKGAGWVRCTKTKRKKS